MADIRDAFRLMWKRPGYTTLAVLMLALGTGANAAMFSVIDGVMLRSPFNRPSEIVRVTAVNAKGQTSAVPRDRFEQLPSLTHIFAAVAERSIGSPIVTGVSVSRRTQVECLPAAMADVLGSRPLMGRWYTPAEDRPGGPAVILATYAFWQGALGADPNVLGRAIILDGEPAAIIGVMAPGFDGPLSLLNRDILAPYGQSTPGRGRYGCRPLDATTTVFARLQPHLTPAAAALALNAALERRDDATGAPIRFGVVPVEEDTVSGVRQPLFLLTGAVIAILLIACANVANLGLERLIGRRREIAVRIALGATRSRIVRQTIVEHMMQAAVGAAIGVAVAALFMNALVSLLPRSLPHIAAISLNGRVLAATIGLSLLGGLLIGVVPAFQASATSVQGAFADGGRAMTSGSRRMRSGLVVVELALGVVLLIGALLMVRTFLTLRPSAPGFDPTNKLLALTRLPAQMTPGDRLSFVDDVTREVVSVEGVRRVATTTYVPMSRNISVLGLAIDDVKGEVWTGAVTANYFDVMAIPIVRGRGFLDSDDRSTPGPALVNEAFVRRWLPGREALGVAVTIGGQFVPRIDYRIVGVIGDTRTAGLDTRARPQVYLPITQMNNESPTFIVSATPAAMSRLPDAFRGVVARVRPGQLVDRVESYDAMLANEVTTPRFGAWLFGLFAVLAVTLSVLGLVATLSWSVTQRRREIGVRMALGAAGSRVSGMVLWQSLRLAIFGVVLGLGVAAWATQFLEGWLYGVIKPLDATTFAACGTLMLFVSVVAAYAPAHRATRIDPIIALRLG